MQTIKIAWASKVTNTFEADASVTQKLNNRLYAKIRLIGKSNHNRVKFK
jgi:hypothetical protein